jgi:hypothetical protein
MEPQLFYAAPAPGKYFDAAPSLALIKIEIILLLINKI